MQELLELLKDILPNIKWESEDNLVDEGILNSIDIITIISEITEEYDIKISSNEMKAENFNSLQAIYNMINRLSEE